MWVGLKVRVADVDKDVTRSGAAHGVTGQRAPGIVVAVLGCEPAQEGVDRNGMAVGTGQLVRVWDRDAATVAGGFDS